MSTASPRVSARSSIPRLESVDAWRFVAIALMFLDHVCLVVTHLGVLDGSLLRSTFGRLAMPLFFVIAGALVRRFPLVRMLGVFGWGLVVPLFVPWIDAPNVLVWYVAGAGVLVLARRVGLPVWLLVVPALTFAANGYDLGIGTSYQPAALLALMALGSMVGPVAFPPLALPAWCRAVGRRSLLFYVAHLFVLDFVVSVVSGRITNGPLT